MILLFQKKKLSGISGIDTRKLTRILRNSGVVKGKIVNADANEDTIVAELTNTTFPVNQDEEVSTKTPFANPGRAFKVGTEACCDRLHGLFLSEGKDRTDLLIV